MIVIPTFRGFLGGSKIPALSLSVSLVKPGFEMGIGSGGYTYQPAGNGWNMGSSCGVTGQNSPWISGNPPEGSNCAYIQQGGTTANQMSQSISTTPGTKYRVYCSGSCRPAPYNPMNFDIQLDGVKIGEFTGSVPGTFYLVSASFTATATSHTFGFQGQNPAGGDKAVLIDDVKIFYPDT